MPIEPPTATMAICAAESWCRSPSSWTRAGAADAMGMLQHSMTGRPVLRQVAFIVEIAKT